MNMNELSNNSIVFIRYSQHYYRRIYQFLKMSKVLQRVETTLRCFYIFNSKLSRKEGEEFKKILYYSPEDIELNTKIKDVGLSEAIIQFTSTFVSENDCKALHTQKTTQLFYQPESGYWIVMVLNVPKEVNSKDGIEIPEYRGSEVQDRMYRILLQQCYNMYRLSYGTFHSNLTVNGMENDFNDRGEQLKEKLSTFFNEYLKFLKIPVSDALSFMQSIQYLPLEQALFIRSHNFINMVRATFPIINDAILMYDEQIICGGKILPTELCSLHCYIQNLFQTEGDARTRDTQLESPRTENYENFSFVTTVEDEEPSANLTKVYLTFNDTLSCYFLVIYRILNAVLCLIINDAELTPNIDFYTELKSFARPQLEGIAKNIDEYIKKQQSLRKANSSTSLSVLTSSNNIDDSLTPKYISVNEQSLKHLSNIPSGKSLRQIPANVLNIIADLIPFERNTDVGESHLTAREVQVKTTNDFWIVQRLWNLRQCYVVIHNSKATLLDITQEAKRIFDKEFTDDVFFDK